jgi:SAM-dependent methyltransferase
VVASGNTSIDSLGRLSFLVESMNSRIEMGKPTPVEGYYADKIEALQDLFGTSAVVLTDEALQVGPNQQYPIVDDVIVLLEPAQYPPRLRARLGWGSDPGLDAGIAYAPDIQFTFGEEWQRFPDILAEHEHEFGRYFDLVDVGSLREARVCDLGCGIGRWSYFLRHEVRELILVDFSEAIFVARSNLRDSGNALFFMGDLTRLPFRNDFADFLFCLGVLHHLPTPALDEVRRLRRFSPLLLIYLYYALDNRPIHYRALLKSVSAARVVLSEVRNPFLRGLWTWMLTALVYLPLVNLGRMLRLIGLSSHVPLYDGYHRDSIQRIRQDVYDRFFTRIEQRVRRDEIEGVLDSFSSVQIADTLPYWHFLCRR